jgi:hypothetical protein
MLVSRGFGSDPLEITLEIAPRRGRGILLDQQRCGGMPAKQRQKPRECRFR